MSQVRPPLTSILRASLCVCLFVRVCLSRHLPSPKNVIRRPPYPCWQHQQGKRKSMTPSLWCSFTVQPGACDALICPHEISSPLVKPLEGLNRRCVLIWMTSAPTIGCRGAHTWAVTFSTLRPKRECYRTHTQLELLVGKFQLYGSPGVALYVGMREELSSSIA